MVRPLQPVDGAGWGGRHQDRDHRLCAFVGRGGRELAADLATRLGRQGIARRIAIADTLGAAWALARFAPTDEATILPPLATRAGLAPLPVEALRLDPATVQGLRRVGLRRVGDLCAMPRDALACRFGDTVTRRLDQALGDLPEPLSPLGEPPVRRVRLSFTEPIADPADLARAAERLAADLVLRLAQQGSGARRLDLALHRVDGRVEHIALGTARPSRDPRHLAALFNARLDTVDPGLGVEDMILAVFAVEPLPPEQIGFAGAGADAQTLSLAPLLDRLGNRLGLEALTRIETRESHIPERAAVAVAVDKSEPYRGKAPLPPERPQGRPAGGFPASPPPGAEPVLGPRFARTRGRRPPPSRERLILVRPRIFASPLRGRPRPPGRPARAGRPGQRAVGVRVEKARPIRLFEPPEPIEAFWLLPDDPPFRFTWRRQAHRVSRADGPERIAEEWWRPGASGGGIRDYYRVEDKDGRRFWLFRSGLAGGDRPPCWYLHGVFA